MIYCFLNDHDSCLLNASVDLWNCGTVETGARSLRAHRDNDFELPDDMEGGIIKASLDL